MVANRTSPSLKGSFKPTWCPGCGNYAVLAALDKALVDLVIPAETVVVCSGIGCSSRFPFFMRTYGFHGLHGRALTVATGLKIARPDLTVVVTSGDGDAVSIGGNHFIHTLRRNIDLTCIIMDNQVYGMTKGQTSPTSRRGLVTKSTPYGAQDTPIGPAWLALAVGATFVAQGSAHDPKELQELIRNGIEHRGVAIVSVTTPCVTFNPANDYEFYREHSFSVLDRYPDYEPSDRFAAMKMIEGHPEMFPLGVLYRATKPTMGDGLTAVAECSGAGEMTLNDVAEGFR
jgi:2-oxoglutarate ferredoxin oxidoreductase subunit beta